jgi:hypothetical protein
LTSPDSIALPCSANQKNRARRGIAQARAAFAAAVAEKPAGRFMIRSRTRVVKRHLEGDW